MQVFLNEKSFEDDADIDGIVRSLRVSTDYLDKQGLKLNANFSTLGSWFSKMEEFCDGSTRNYIPSLLRLICDCKENTGPYSFHFFCHQNLNLSISQDLSNYSLAIATNKFLLKQLTAVLNIGESIYSARRKIPIVRSPINHDSDDDLANIPCFSNAKEIIQYNLLFERIKPIIAKEDFADFSKEYFIFKKTFDIDNWSPKVFQASSTILDPRRAFPAIGYPNMHKQISSWDIKRKDYLGNVYQYITLGETVLRLHGYEKNKSLSRHYNRQVFEAGRGNSKLLISIDTENGAFEVIDNSGTHIGVYGYNGHLIKQYKDIKDISSHSLSDVPTYMFMF